VPKAGGTDRARPIRTDRVGDSIAMTARRLTERAPG